MPTTTSNINLQTTGYTITVGEIIDEFEKAKNRQAKKERFFTKRKIWSDGYEMGNYRFIMKQ